MKTRVVAVTVTVVVMALAMAACGGDDDGGVGIDRQTAGGGGSATLTVGDQTWTFTSVLCAFGEEEIGQPGAEFVLSSIQDGMQMHASIDGSGHLVSLNDIDDFENPKVSLEALGAGFIELDGKHVRADAEFDDDTSDGLTTVDGVLEATCP